MTFELNRVYFGDCRDSMRKMIAAGVRVNMICTSPPYWGLRDYGVPGQLGLEPTPEEYVANMVEVFRLARDLLADDGTLWLNLGDSYNAHPGQRKTTDKVGAKQETNAGSNSAGSRHVVGLAAKQLLGIPWRVAFALQADGWYLRQDIIWAKPNPMPESVTDRCTKSHEYIFLLTKHARYYYDADAIADPLSSASIERLSQPNLENQEGSDRVPGKTNGNMKAVARDIGIGAAARPRKGCPNVITYGGSDKPYTGRSTKDYEVGGAQDASATKARIVDSILRGDLVTRNKRSVWTVTTKPFKGAHFATFPPDLIEPCILAGTSQHGHCEKCGAGWDRDLDEKSINRNELPTGHPEYRPRRYDEGKAGDPQSPGAGQRFRVAETKGWVASCNCGVGAIPGVVFDPFLGSGTTAEVAQRLGRNWLGCELNECYAPLQKKRTEQLGLPV